LRWRLVEGWGRCLVSLGMRRSIEGVLMGELWRV
jgi:hypothetical protein